MKATPSCALERISLLAPRDEELSYDAYQLKQKFLPIPPA